MTAVTWHELRDRDEAAAAGGRCQCCAMILRNGVQQDNPAAYRWTIRPGHDVLLCVRCCAIWRRTAAYDPAMLPDRIVSL